jgi:hypothetical protein
MADDDVFAMMVDACLAAHEAVLRSGTPEMKMLCRALLMEIGREAAKRAGESSSDTEKAGGE